MRSCTSYCLQAVYSCGTKDACKKKIKFRMKIHLQREVVSFKPLVLKGLHWLMPVKTLAHHFSGFF